MKFQLVDRILSLEPGTRIVTSKALSLAEEYLADHFPSFPVMPGVLMLEAMVQSAAWLVRVTSGFSHSIVVLKSASHVKYKSFVMPGRVLETEVKARRIEEGESAFSGRGRADGEVVVEARLELVHRNLAEESALLAGRDARLILWWKEQYELLRWGGAPAVTQ